MSSLRLLPAALLALSLSGAPTAAQEAPEPLWTVEGITEYRLDNGLRVLLFPDPSKSTVTVNVTYLVGSRHEGRGEKGMAHLLEHMVFKGTDTFENIWGALEDHGANFNGTTWLDRTNYYETLPATDENLEFALHMEADRMVNSRIAGEDLAREFSVVRNEFEMGENDPVGILFERIVATAYLWHNYGLSTIGNRSDIERVPVDNLRRFYERYYQPDNAMLVLAGRFDPDRALELIQEHFGAIPRPERMLEDSHTVEPVQDGARFVKLERVASVQATGACYHVCAGPHPDAAPLLLLASILEDRPSGRLYEALVPAGLATGVNASIWPTAEPGFFMVMAESGLDQDVHAAHDRMIRVVEGLGETGVTEEEVERARRQFLKGFKLGMNDPGRVGIELSEWQAQGDWRLMFVFRDRIKGVTPADVQRVARTYLVGSNRTSGIFTPSDDPVRAEVPETPDVLALVDGYEGSEEVAVGEAFDPTPENIEARTTRVALGEDVRLAMLPKKTRGERVVARFTFHYGDEASLKDHKVALGMLPRMLMRGTERLGFQELRDEIDRLESSIGVSGEAGALTASITTDREHMEAAVRLLGEILRTPTVPAEEFEIVRKEAVAALEEGRTDPMRIAFHEMSRRTRPFPPESFHHVPTMEETLELTRAVTRDGLAELHAGLIGGQHAEISLVGDFDPAEAQALLREVLGGWESPAPYARVARPFRPVEAQPASIDTPDKEMAIVATGSTVKLSDHDPDFAAIEFANYVLGQSAKSRLLNRLRHEGGLSYGAGSMLQSSAQDEVTVISGFAICAPQNAFEAQAAMNEEIQRWIAEGLTAEELAEGKQGFAAQFENSLADDGYVATQLVRDLEIGRTFEFHADRMREIQGLELPGIAETLKDRLEDVGRFELLVGDLEAARPGE